MSNNEEVILDEGVEYVEVQEPHTIETGDSVKVKQVLDDATIEAVQEIGYSINYYWENIKLLVMFVSCIFALVAQFAPIPFPASRPVLGICVFSYFILSCAFQFIVTFIDKDTIIITHPKVNAADVMRIRSNFPKYTEYFTLSIQGLDPSTPVTEAKMYVGKYFTEKGEFDQAAYVKDVHSVVKLYEQKAYGEHHYNHKSD